MNIPGLLRAESQRIIPTGTIISGGRGGQEARPIIGELRLEVPPGNLIRILECIIFILSM